MQAIKVPYESHLGRPTKDKISYRAVPGQTRMGKPMWESFGTYMGLPMWECP
ncbi:hypothetical protein DPMN_058956 [Dreissena polymorpha]|uniref:Uncharacterized protein n=1 Tax=Dreissena polymorpha TaxID=45954 RepID=A0A9D4HED8_DREPO|nr:hypothetical protein DPMN_058956 [Dreissena polymorpha]